MNCSYSGGFTVYLEESYNKSFSSGFNFKTWHYLFHSECLFVKRDIMDHTALAVNDLTIKYGDVCQVVDIIVANKQQLVNISSLKL